jgi:hypothetical protein
VRAADGVCRDVQTKGTGDASAVRQPILKSDNALCLRFRRFDTSRLSRARTLPSHDRTVASPVIDDKDRIAGGYRWSASFA